MFLLLCAIVQDYEVYVGRRFVPIEAAIGDPPDVFP